MHSADLGRTEKFWPAYRRRRYRGSGSRGNGVYITAAEAVIPLPVDMAPVDASIVGIVDRIDLQK